MYYIGTTVEPGVRPFDASITYYTCHNHGQEEETDDLDLESIIREPITNEKNFNRHTPNSKSILQCSQLAPDCQAVVNVYPV